MEVIDAQVHLARPGSSPAPAASANIALQVGIEQMLAAMTDVGVDAALVTTRSLGNQSNDYPLAAASAHPTRFAVVGTIDPTLTDIEDSLQRWRTQPGMLGVRVVVLTPEQIGAWRRLEYEPLLAAAERHGVPMCIYPPRLLPEIVPAIRRHPSLQFVIDHLGLPQPTSRTDRDQPPFARIHDLLALAQFPNVAVKLTGVPTLATDPFPYPDLWNHIHAVLSAFGLQRIMWGSDWTRTAPWCSYQASVDYLRDTNELSDTDKEWLFSRSLRAIFRWPSTVTDTPS